jgi:hypothetical protein
MRMFRLSWLSMLLLSVAISPFPAAAQAPLTVQPSGSDSGSGAGLAKVSVAATSPASPPGSFDEVIDRVVEREHLLLGQMRNLRPMVETYIQNLKSDANGNSVPINDQYFLGRLDMSDGPEDVSFLGQSGFGRSSFRKLTAIFRCTFNPWVSHR